MRSVAALRTTAIGTMPERALLALMFGSGLVGCDNPVSPPDSVVVDVSETATGTSIGSIRVEQMADGARFTPSLTSLAPGEHGFHVHVNPNCGMAGQDVQRHNASLADAFRLASGDAADIAGRCT